MNRQPNPRIVAPAASPQEAAAIAAALERFMRDTAPARELVRTDDRGAWRRAGLREGAHVAPGDLVPWDSARR